MADCPVLPKYFAVEPAQHPFPPLVSTNLWNQCLQPSIEFVSCSLLKRPSPKPPRKMVHQGQKLLLMLLKRLNLAAAAMPSLSYPPLLATAIVVVLVVAAAAVG